MTRLEKKLRASLRRLGIAEGDKVLVAVSGGADSTALLDAFVRLRRCAKTPDEIFAVHCNHLLRGEESDADEAFVRGQAPAYGVPLFVGSFNASALAEDQSRNLEATARDLRYGGFQTAAAHFGANIIATAHTRDDQVETLLMRLLRGTGAEGLRGIHESAVLPSGARLIRPLLNVTRAEVIEHCGHYGIGFRTDSSNFSTDFTRNRVRLELLPQMRTYNPRFDESLLRLSGQMTEDGDCLSGSAAELLDRALQPEQDWSLDLKLLQKAHPAIRRRVLRLWLKWGRGDLNRIDAAHLLSLESLATRSEGGRHIELPGGWQVWRRAGRLLLLKAGVDEEGADALQTDRAQ